MAWPRERLRNFQLIPWEAPQEWTTREIWKKLSHMNHQGTLTFIREYYIPSVSTMYHFNVSMLLMCLYKVMDYYIANKVQIRNNMKSCKKCFWDILKLKIPLKWILRKILKPLHDEVKGLFATDISTTIKKWYVFEKFSKKYRCLFCSVNLIDQI